MAITYSIDSGADAAKFNINATTGALTFKTAPDFEAPGDANRDNIYEVVIKATDATGLSSTKTMTVTVTDVSEGSPPQITSAGAISVKENQTTVLTVTATDPDARRDRQPADGHPGRGGQRAERPLRDAFAQAVGASAGLLEDRSSEGVAVPGRPARRSRSRHTPLRSRLPAGTCAIRHHANRLRRIRLRHAFAVHLLECRHRSAHHPIAARSSQSEHHVKVSAHRHQQGLRHRQSTGRIASHDTRVPDLVPA